MKKVYHFFISLPIIFTLITSIIFDVIGFVEAYHGVKGLLKGEIHSGSHPGMRLFESLDMYLIGFLFLIFSLGFAQLFMPNTKLLSALTKITPNWLKIKNFTELKLILWETILTAMVILFATEMLKNKGQFQWESTVIPLGIFLIALSGYFIRKGEKLMEKKD